ncbi:MAG: A/G-specific adenine glycosylase [Alphaproteobacteria bacterium]|jgi:A/G-specific adenine glycosylase|nr:A/G-specific adenine glycosylase [Alphaproteobacteria bacterium]MBU2043338.1 A/G-specific adenine glycosylase [Alphaproteobacteria bacterium]MBU2127022.1 A/G-specific adenine glycosylase [Alphaproteobacteria bacterium]MBU2207234.1 A/G-specific adenine glycosylase [Alphaproteobacteria bacterium]MBU2289679.1 A/G-specific adenine glycosylase [Alphaproteobacteria bacterium]
MSPAALRTALLDWYDANGRSLAWRARPGSPAPDPYRVWLSEVMLQQTTTPHATPYFEAFTARWPTVSDLAAAADSDVMAAWAGLGYYARARNLLACARAVANAHAGVFPDTEAGLLALPGVGAYTAAAVAAIAFDRPANVVDGNVERVMARLFAVGTPLPAAKPELKRLAATLVADDRPGDWPQALMDLGATVCRPGRPLCEACPLTAWCAAFASGDPGRWPLKTKKADRPHRTGVAWVLRDAQGRVGLVRRPDKGLLGGMLGLPTSEWAAEAAGTVPSVAADWREAGAIDHVFTHFSLTLTVRVADGGGDFIWTDPEEALTSLPTVFRKALERGLA